MKTTILTIALALATMPLTFAAQTPAPAAPAASKPAAAAPVKTTRKHHKKAAKKTVNTAPPARWTRRRGFFCGTRLRIVHPGASSDVQQERR
jgi:hypothetical protein